MMMTNEIDDRSATPAKRQRIAKQMARAGLCSRRDAEAWILAGRVSINGEVLTSPARDVGAEDIILVDGAALQAAEKTRLFLFHKPRGLVTSDHDPEGRATVFDYLRENWPEGPRVVSIGRLDINTEGLLLLTNDGGLARVLELPQTGWVRRYRVRAKGTADLAALDALAGGITIDGIDYAAVEAKLDRVQGANCWLTIGLREGKNREVKRILEHLGLEVNRLIRISFGPFQLLDLPDGAVEEVRTRVLRDQLGPSLAAQADVSFEIEEPQAKKDASKPKSQPPHEPKPRRRPQDRRGDGLEHERRGRNEETAPRRDRPVGRPRKHVSSLRAAERAATQGGPRKRVERSDTQDRRARTVAVERLVSTQPNKADRPKPRSASSRTREESRQGRRRNASPSRDGHELARDREAGGGASRGRSAREERGQQRGSPSAKGKRERVARSGGDRNERTSHKPRSADDMQHRRTPSKGKLPHYAARSRRGGDARPAQAKGGKPRGSSRPKR